MPRHKYKYFEVTCLTPKVFRIDEMRAAVEHLRSLEQRGHVGLTAVMHSYRSPKFGFRYGGRPMLHLSQIAGKTPSEVWGMFDAEADDQIRGLEHRFSAGHGEP